MLIVGVQVGAEIQDAKRSADHGREVLRLTAIVVYDNMPFGRWKQQLKRGPISDLLESDNVGLKQLNDLPQLCQTVVLLLNSGA